MNEAVPRAHLERFRQIVNGRLGLRFEDDKLPLLSATLLERHAAAGLDVATYLARLAAPDERDELRALAERLTVGETYFFRNGNDLQAFLGAVLPERTRARAAERVLRLLSVGCSSGEEPYTLAMLLHDVPRLASWDVAIRGVDVNPAAIRRATRARYTAWSLRQTSPDLRRRFFHAEHGGFRLVEAIRRRVAFEERNLLDPDPGLWAPDAYDVVFCRNVLMYLAPEVAAQVVTRIEGALAPGGFLFLGHAETLRGVSTAFHLRHSHGTFYYQRKEGGDATLDAAQPSWPTVTEAAEEAQDVHWTDAIRAASARVAALSAPVEAGPADARPASREAGGEVRDATWIRVTRALDLLRHDRHAEALSALGGASPEEDTDALLLRAVLLASSGDPGAAERVCAQVLERDELNAEAHYVMALCREHAGDRAAAMDHDRYALYLDPTFAMPRLHLGLLAKRAGDGRAAARELSAALTLLAGEDASRILLLGGGFSRDALVALCRAELKAHGDREPR